MIWPTKKLGDILPIVTGKLDVNQGDTDGTFPFYTCSVDVSRINKTSFDGEAILIAGNGDFWVKYHSDGPFDAYQRTYVLQLKTTTVSLKYLYYFLPNEIGQLTSQGGVIKYLRLPQLKNIEIPLPPLAEQKKIVTKIERAFAKIDEAARLRAAADTDASGLLGAALDRVFEGAKEKGWEEKRLDALFEINRGGSPRPIKSYITDAANGINWIKIGDAQEGTKYISSTAQKITPAGLKKTRLVKEGDLLLSNSMSFGHPYIMKTDGAIHDGWLLLRAKAKDIDLDYAYYILGSQNLYRQFEDAASGAVVKNLNTSLVSRVKIPVPPIAEQKKIAAELDALSEKVRKLRQLQGEVGEELKELKKAVLREAFEQK